MKTRIVVLAGAAMSLLVSGPVIAEGEYDNSITYFSKPYEAQKMPQGWMAMPAPPRNNMPANTLMPSISAEAKMRSYQTSMMFNPMSLRQMISMMVVKKKAAKGVSFDDVMQSMDLRANALNMKKVGHNTPYKLIADMTGKESPRLEIVSYCDVLTMRQILDYVPEFGAFVPCRITVLEDARKDIWILSMDWDVRWLDTSPNPNKISPELREKAIKVREMIEEIMEAGANGDL